MVVSAHEFAVLQGMEADEPTGFTYKILWKQQPPLCYTTLLYQQLFSDSWRGKEYI